MIIKDLPSLKKFFLRIKNPILGAGVYAFNRLGPEEFLKDYELLSLYWSKETELIKRNIPTFCLEEKIKKRIKPRNSASLLCHSLTKKHLRKIKNPLILVYKSSKRIEKLAKRYHWQIALSPARFGKPLFEDKIKFRGILEKIKAPPCPGRIVSLPWVLKTSFLELKKEFGLPFVLQHPRRAGGKGTFFINDENGLLKAKKALKEKPAKKVILAKFIKGPSPSITGCVTRFGIFSTRPQYQICDIPLLYKREVGSGLFCGHDFSASNFSKEVLSQAEEIVERVGNYLKKFYYRGIFGLDFILDEKQQRLYVTECNPRLLGAFPTLTMVQIENGEPPILGFHLLEFLNVPCQIDVKMVNYLMWEKKEGVQMILHNPLQKEAIQKGEIEPASYKLTTYNLQLTTNNQQLTTNNKQLTTNKIQESRIPPPPRLRRASKNQKLKVKMSGLKMIRTGYALKDLKSKNEFLVTEGLQKKGTKIAPYQRLLRLLTKKRVLKDNLKDISFEVKIFIKEVLANLKLKIPPPCSSPSLSGRKGGGREK